MIAGDGNLPIEFAINAKNSGFEVVAISLSSDNRHKLKNYCNKVYNYGPGEIKKIKQTLKDEGIKQLTFLGKVHKGLLLRRPKFDMEALELLKNAPKLNDDAVMLTIVSELEKILEKIGTIVLDQTIFIKNLLIPNGILGKTQPTDEQLKDIEYGFRLAKEMGKLDIGQSVVVKDKMIMAVEAIEGTDRCIQRGCRLAKKDAVVVKVSKPNQDKRFDIPTIGVNTLKTMKKFKGKVLAVEAGETIIVNQNE
ncbi:MAG: hypothetical protein BHW64_04205 [Candidatus Melainabacteria bacterium LEY3_CP_29_8]|nr:MAG: hypothetical protein BHW64_04205 [Candidatus Melainabacteria bacterium LEY3_CP_29_8]